MRANQTRMIELYDNKMGMSFIWNDTFEGHPYHNCINIIFNNTGLHLNNAELHIFLEDVQNALDKGINCCGEDSGNCKSMLLETPMSQLSFAMSYNDLVAMKNLIKGTLFELELIDLLKGL